MNVPLLQEIKARILAEPDAFRTDVWSCGTAHCIAGWALALNGHDIAVISAVNLGLLPNGQTVRATAANILDITHTQRFDPESDPYYDGDSNIEADRLFYVEAWPDDLQALYYDVDVDEDNETKDTTTARRDRAQIAADRIERFIATNGVE